MENLFRYRIKELRELNKLTQLELANKINVKEQTISNYEAGKRQPSFEILLNLANVLGTSLDYLVGKDNTWKYDLPEDIRDFVLAPENDFYIALAEDVKDAVEKHGVLPETVKDFIVALIRDAKNRQKK